jgi:hypothetical protein
MKEKARKETHPRDGEVWVNPATESLRKDECLCFNCAKCKPGQPDHCPIAQALFEICKKGKVALAVTRCPEWETNVVSEGVRSTPIDTSGNELNQVNLGKHLDVLLGEKKDKNKKTRTTREEFSKELFEKFGVKLDENPFDLPLCPHGTTPRKIVELVKKGEPLPKEEEGCATVRRYYEALIACDKDLTEDEQKSAGILDGYLEDLKNRKPEEEKK